MKIKIELNTYINQDFTLLQAEDKLTLSNYDNNQNLVVLKYKDHEIIVAIGELKEAANRATDY